MKKIGVSNGRKLISVKLLEGGVKGINIAFDDFSGDYVKSFKGKLRSPVTVEVRDGIADLGSYLLDICGYPLEGKDREVVAANVEVCGITYEDNKGFVLSGVLKVLDGTKQINLVTPLIGDESEYPGYGEIEYKIGNIFMDTMDYLNEKKVISKQLALQLQNERIPIEGFSKEALDNMTEGELTAYCENHLIQKNYMIITSDQVEKVIDSSPSKPKKVSAPKVMKEAVIEKEDPIVEDAEEVIDFEEQEAVEDVEDVSDVDDSQEYDAAGDEDEDFDF